MSSFSTRGLTAILAGPVQRILQDVQVFGLKAGPAEAPTAGPEEEGGGVEVARSNSPVETVPAGVIRGVRAVGPPAASSPRAGAPAEAAVATSRQPGMRTASELVRTVEGNAPRGAPGHQPGAEQPSRTAGRSSSLPGSKPLPESTVAAAPLPRLILRKEPGVSAPRAPARAVPPSSPPSAAPSEVLEGVMLPRPAEGAPARAPEAPRGVAERLAKGSEERGIPVRSVSSPEAQPVPLTARAPSEVSAEDGAQAPLTPTAVPHGVSSPVSSEPPQAPSSERPSTKALPRLVLRRAPVAARDSQPRAVVASVPESQVRTPEPQQPPRVTPPAATEVRSSLEPAAAVPPRGESAGSRRERGEGIPLTPRGPRWSSREPAEPQGLEWGGQTAPVPERARLAPVELSSARGSPFAPGLPAPVFAPVASAPPGAPAQPLFTSPPESLLRDGAAFAPPAAEAPALDRERLEEMLVDILQAAARGEGVEV
jgi:hypothetical protein